MVASVVAAIFGALAAVGRVDQPCCGTLEVREAAKAPAGDGASPSRVLRGVGIESAAFLTGDWSAERPTRDGGANLTQEIWSAPSGNNMMGMFRWLGADGSARVFELLTITEEHDTLVLRLRHQDAAGHAWEEQDSPATLHLARLASGDPESDRPTIAVFEDTTESCDLAACEYDGSVAGHLTITVKFDDPQRDELVFVLASPDAPVSSGGAAEPALGREKAPGAASALPPDEARAVFARFASLSGEWIGRSTKGWEDRIIYQTVADGSVVVERSFDAHPGEQMYTMVHIDGDRLMLTHYCVAGNQPRLVCTAWDEPSGAATFEFLDATNLASRDAGHMDKVVVRFLDDQHFSAQWTWYQDGVESWMEEIVHERWRRRPLWTRAISWGAYLLRDWL